MSITKAKKLNPENFVQRKKDNETLFYKEPKFNFLKDHHGLRPGKAHMFLAPTGGGKTSLVRTVTKDLCTNHKVLMITTEEELEDVETASAYAKTPIENDNFSMIEEKQILEESGIDIGKYMHFLEWELVSGNIDILVFDNLTTSKIYTNIENSLDFFKRLKDLVNKLKIPLIIVAHTTTSVKNGIFFEASDVRGSRDVSLLTEFLYCLFRFSEECDGHIRYANFVYVDKSRNQPNIKDCYRIFFDKDTKEYISDQKATMEEFKNFVLSSGRKKRG